MPVKRRQPKRRLDVLTLNQQSHLACGGYLFPGEHAEGAEFEDEAHRREAWLQHRDSIMTDWSHTGRRPDAFWTYERGWPEDAESESHAVHLLPDTTAEERAGIEQDWLRWVYVVLSSAIHNPKARPREHVLEWYGVPHGFYDAHAPAIRRRLEAESRKWREECARARGGNGHRHKL